MCCNHSWNDKRETGGGGGVAHVNSFTEQESNYLAQF